MSDNEVLTSRAACASCKHQRKRCQKSCVMAPHFPQRLTAEFQAVHKIFGIANVTKAIKALGLAQQREAIKSFIWEAIMWDKNQVHGPYGEVKRLEDRIRFLEEDGHHKDIEVKRLEERIRFLEEDGHHKEIVIKNLSQQVLLQWDNGLANSCDDNGTLTNSDSSSAMNVNNYVSVLEEEMGNGLVGSYIQGREFIQDVNPNSFNYCSSSFVQEHQVRMMNQGREGIVGQNSICSSSGVLPRRGERVGGFGDHDGVMQYAAASRSSLVDYATSQQHVRVTNHNNILQGSRFPPQKQVYHG